MVVACCALTLPQVPHAHLELCPQCCAIDYMVHTLDGTACLLNNNRIFPSRCDALS